MVCDSAIDACFSLVNLLVLWKKIKQKNLLMFIVFLLFRSISRGEEKERPEEGGITSCIFVDDLLNAWLLCYRVVVFLSVIY